MKRIILLCLFGLLLSLALTSGAIAQSGATLTTDKPDYMPGEVALISGVGFLPGELIDLSIAIQDPDTGEWIADWDWAQGYCDEDGAFVAEYLVPDRALARSLRATAMGLGSGLVAGVTFTDAAAANVVFATQGLPPGTSVTVSWSGTNNGGNAISGPTAFSSPGPTAAIGTQQGSTFTYSFPATIDVSDDTYSLVSTSPESPFTTPSGDPPIPTTTVTATYVKESSENQPPAITPLNPTVQLGAWVGCLGVGTGFGKAFSVTYACVGSGSDWTVQATFTLPDSTTLTVDVATVTDPDGDDVDVDLSNGTDPVTISGPGNGSAGFSVDVAATDGNNSVGPTTCDGTANAQITYDFVGFLSPLSPEGSPTARLVKQGATVPVKFQLLDCCGTAITDLNLPGTGWPEIDVYYQQGNAPDGDPEITDAGSSNDNDICFRYADPNWIYNLKTTTSYCVGNTYKVVVTLNDGTTHEGYISIKK